MYSEETRSSNLAKFLAIYDYAFVDTCSLMCDSFPAFMDLLSQSKEYWKKDFHFVVLAECVKELEKHSQNKERPEAAIEAKRALKILKRDQRHFAKKRTLEIPKTAVKDVFADHAIYTQASALRIQYKVLVITQDKTLTNDLRKLNELDSMRGRYVMVYRLNSKGELEENPGLSADESARKHAEIIKNTEAKYHFLSKNKPSFDDDKTNKKQPEPSAISDIITNDRRLGANLSNPNYSPEKKFADIETQLALLKKVGKQKVAELSLTFNEEALLEKKKSLQFGQVNEVKKPERVSVEQKPVKEEPKPKKAPKAAKKAPAPEAENEVPEAGPKKKVAKKPTPQIDEAEIDLIKKEDKKLNANINNPNYPIDSKIRDVEAQKARIKGLSQDIQKDLFFSATKLAAKLRTLKSEKAKAE